jgi:hypothetical protein
VSGLPATRWCVCVLLGAACWLARAPAHAFSDLERYPQPSLEGGGGGRLFTGSPADGYACSVCHEGGPEPQVVVYGLPIDGYVPGQTYNVEVVWSDPDPSVEHSMHLEIVDRTTRRAAGTVALLDDASVDAAARCRSAKQEPADYTIEGEGRQVVGVSPCGASHLRFRFTAPDLPEAIFAGSVVRSDSHASPEGDGVQNLSLALRRAGEPNRAVANCTITGARADGAGLLLGALGLLGAALARRSGRR